MPDAPEEKEIYTGLPNNLAPMGLPAIYAEVIPGVTSSNGVVKFHLARNDLPFTMGTSTTERLTPVCQVTMPLLGFVNTVIFFNSYLEHLISVGEVNRDAVEKMKAAYGEETRDAK